MLRLFTGGDLFHIRTASVYPNDYQEVVKIARKEKADNARPALEKDLPSIDDYDVIFLGSPQLVRHHAHGLVDVPGKP